MEARDFNPLTNIYPDCLKTFGWSDFLYTTRRIESCQLLLVKYPTPTPEHPSGLLDGLSRISYWPPITYAFHPSELSGGSILLAIWLESSSA